MLTKAFDKYTSKFDMNNRITQLKYNHSYRVSYVSNYLANKMGLSPSGVELATTIGLIHDTGRFEQVEKYNTLSDIGTMDHGDFGAYLLFDQRLIEDFAIKDNHDVIKLCVKGHNKYSINEENLTYKDLFHLRLIRDADKIDIFNIWANLDEIDFKSDGEISEEVKEEFYSHKMIHNENKKTNADALIGTLSYIFDINFNESINYILEEDFIAKMFDRVDNKDKEKLKEIFEYAEKYLKKDVKGAKKYVR